MTAAHRRRMETAARAEPMTRAVARIEKGQRWRFHHSTGTTTDYLVESVEGQQGRMIVRLHHPGVAVEYDPRGWPTRPGELAHVTVAWLHAPKPRDGLGGWWTYEHEGENDDV